MGKRSDFEREPRDLYPTPYKLMIPLFPFLKVNQGMAGDRPVRYIEPCAAAGQMVAHLASQGHECVYACDIEPGARWVKKRDVLAGGKFPKADIAITNPPWRIDILHRMIEILSEQMDTWLLFYSDWHDTVQAGPYRDICKMIVPVGRARWIPGSDNDGKDNCSWYLFSHDHEKHGPDTKFHFR